MFDLLGFVFGSSLLGFAIAAFFARDQLAFCALWAVLFSLNLAVVRYSNPQKSQGNWKPHAFFVSPGSALSRALFFLLFLLGLVFLALFPNRVDRISLLTASALGFCFLASGMATDFVFSRGQETLARRHSAVSSVVFLVLGGVVATNNSSLNAALATLVITKISELSALYRIRSRWIELGD